MATKTSDGWSRTMALCIDGEIVPNIEYRIEGTPCEHVYERSPLLYTDRVADQFPEDLFLAEIGARSYLATAFHDSSGQALGHVGVIHDRPLPEDIREQSLFPVFAPLIAAELERRQSEKQRLDVQRSLLESQRLESLGVLAGGIAHDFNNILVAILGNADLAISRQEPTAPSVPNLHAIRDAGERAALLCRQMLAYAGKGALRTQPEDLNKVIEELTRLMQVSAPKKSTLHLELESRLPAISADAAQLQQVVLNLLTNAWDAIGDEAGVVTVTTRMREMSAADLQETRLGDGLRAGRFVVLAVADTGCGMSESTLARVFDPFFTTKPRGHGLGLAALAGILRRHGGTIHVESKVGEGSRFELFFPALEGPVPLFRAPADEERAGEGHVLIVDDEPSILAVAEQMLQDAGYEVTSVSDGGEAIEVFRERADEFSCVLLDLSMPRKNGEETLRELRGIRDDIPIVLSSGFLESDIVSRFGDGELSGVIDKPYRSARLIEKIHEAIRSR